MTQPGLAAWLVVLACAQAQASSIAETAQQMRSWAATAHFVVQAWSAHQLPTPYSQRTLVAAQREVDKALRELEHDARPDDARAPLREHTHALHDALATARDALSHDQPEAAASALDRLQSIAVALRGIE